MLPISLTIQGVYAYLEEQFIDFEDLTATGLFGIFGPVGAGKSTILEAISVALYGENDRLDTTNFWYNLLNLRSDKAAIVFIFEYEGVRYKFEARWRRNTKKFHDISYKERNGYKWEHESWIPVSNNAADILGLSYDHFKRTIIIPQGQFREFLELKPKERRTMIKEIFALQRFDLSEKINTHYKEAEAQRLLLEGELKAYTDADPSRLDIYASELERLRQQLATAAQQLEKEEAALRSVIALHEKWLRLQALRQEAALAQSQLPGFLLRRQQLQTYINVQATFKSHIDQLQSLHTQQEQLHRNRETLESALERLQAQKATCDEEYNGVRSSYEHLSDKQKQVSDFDITLRLITCFRNKEHLQQRIRAGQDHILHKKQEADKTAAAIQEVQTARAQLAEHPLDYELIQQIDQWLQTRELYITETGRTRQQLSQREQALQHTLQQFSPYSPEQEAYTALFEQQRDKLQASLQEIRAEEQQLLIRSELQQYAHSLEEGCPCPLCGATAHPRVLQAEDLAPQLAEIRNRLDACREAEQALEKQWKACDKLAMEADGHRKALAELQQALASGEANLAGHEAGYVFDVLPKNDLASYPALKQSFFRNEQQKQSLRSQLEALQEAAERHRADLTKFEEGVALIEKQVAALEAEIGIHFSNIAVIDANHYIRQGAEAVEQQKHIIAAQIQDTETRYHSLTAALKELEQEISKTEGQIESTRHSIAQTQAATAQVEADIRSALQAAGFETLEQVREILEQQPDIQQEQEALDLFFQRHNTLQAGLQELEALLNGQTVDEDRLLSHRNAVAALQQEKDRLIGNISAMQEQQELLARQLREQQALQRSYDAIAVRTAHLDTLRKLFMGDKFIEFVSRSYLLQLCAYANERFHRLTRNQLSLQLNDQNEFEIIDYLNGGKPRSIKTLSGGQAFQASLCMALALAESVQARSGQERNFFFIDEGFGTQDKATLQTVFETLDSLRKEKRIVGIISHVEELQENITKYLYVEKDEQRGSLISQF